ncbi:MAG: ABC transporter permease [Candidatus Bipolaricaulota bacterium]|nr:ABC transporter permease [Candidatus Bipolaricaulota bacterium]MDW8127169.1 ABC transporter permease [Candidatus Bipolaricaulota bacterium]
MRSARALGRELLGSRPFVFIIRRLLTKFLTIPELGVITAVVGVLIIFSLLSDKFLQPQTFASILVRTAELGIVTTGIAFLMIAGEFDLSVSSIFAFVPVVAARLLAQGWPFFLVFLVGLAIAAAVGFVNSQIVLRVGLPSFITTLGMMLLLRGLVLAISKGFLLPFTGDPVAVRLLAGTIVGFFRYSVIWSVLVNVMIAFVLTQTRYGNWVFATGGNKEAARMMGIPVGRVKTINFILCSMFATVAGLIAFARLEMVAPQQGEGMELEAIASAVIGGTLLTGGYGSITGAFLGALLIAMIQQGLVLVGAPPYWYRAFVGFLVVAASILNHLVRIKLKTKLEER